MSNHFNATGNISNIVSVICACANVLIGEAVADGKRIAITKMSKQIGASSNLDDMFVYHIISQYIKNRPDLKMFMGPNGGIGLKPTETVEPV